MNAQEAIKYIENYTWSTTRLGLERTRALLRALGDPQKDLKFIHVAGSNGKGSTCAMLDSVLRSAGYRTGLYTSPYIQGFCERMRVDGENIPGDALCRITERVRDIADTMADHPSQFELVTAIAMEYFREAACDIVVLEVGMGGALDSTNVIDCPEAAVITNIGLEHTEYLGNTLTEIAAAKGGIIKPGCAVVCYESEPEVTETITNICAEQGARFTLSEAEDVTAVSASLDVQCFLWKGKEYAIPLLGAHQLRNAAVALETIEQLLGRGWVISESAVREGLAATAWPARFEALSRSPLFILDGGHNPQCAEALAQNLRDYLPDQKVTFLMGVLADKDFEEMLSAIAPFAEQFICVTPESPRALPAALLCERLRERGLSAQSFDTIPDGIRAALQTGGPVIAFGSLYLAGRVRTLFPAIIKKHQRTSALRARDAIPAEARKEKSAVICERIRASLAYREASTIMLFKAFRSEVDLSLLEQFAPLDGKKLFYPYCVGKHQMLALYPNSDADWELDDYGIRVPILERSQMIPPPRIDLVICPCSAFDGEGHRLGMGAGYYDWFLPQCVNAKKIIAAFEAQRMEQVFTDPWDVVMDSVITEYTE